MKHYDEYTIELLALNDPSVNDQREEFDKHMDECAGCAALYREISEYYKALDGNQYLLERGIQSGEDNGLVVQAGYVQPKPVIRYEQQKGSVPAILWQAIRRRPVVSSLSAIGLAAAIFLLFSIDGLIHTPSPAFLITNDEKGILEVHGEKGEMLWFLRLPTPSAANAWSMNLGIAMSLIADVNNDGKAEVVTTIPGVEGENPAKAILRVYDNGKKEILHKELGIPFTYRSTWYDIHYEPRGLLFGDFGKTGKREFIIGLPHYNSPYALLRLDAQGNEIGSYWKFGHGFGLAAVDLRNDGKKEIIITGCDDENNCAVVIALDPQKIIGRQECTTNRGFGFHASYAELYQIRFPKTDMDLAVPLSKPRIMTVLYETDSTIGFSYTNPQVDINPNYVIQYIFSKNMQLIDIKPGDATLRTHQRLRGEGKVRGDIDSAYIANLKRGVEYWDGKQWRRNGVVAVR